MAGHSQFKNIMHRKGAQDARRGRLFARLIREITVAARHGLPDPAANPRLRAAVAAARQANMPRDTVERAIKKAAGATGGDDYAEVRYEGYGPAGVAVIVEALTDNRNRTASDIRSAFAKHGGALGETNSVSFLFNRLGVIRYPAAVASRRRDAGGGDRGRRRERRKRRRGARGHLRRSRTSSPCATRWKPASAPPETARAGLAPDHHGDPGRGPRRQPAEAAGRAGRQRRRRRTSMPTSTSPTR